MGVRDADGHDLEEGHYPKMHGLFVGIDDYPRHMRLSGCVGDALRLSEAFAPLLSSNRTLLNGDGTQKKILGELQKIGESAKPEDLVVFFFAGQADVIYDRYFIVPVDVVIAGDGYRVQDRVADALPFDTILWMLGHFTCNSLIIIDSQKAASIGFDASRFRNAKSSILVSSAPNELAMEVDVDGVKQGAFTASIVKALRTSYLEKKKLTLIDLFESIYDETKRLTENRQHPILIGTLDYGLVVADPTRARHDHPWA